MSAAITIDASGRIVIPKGIRDQLHLQGGAELEVSVSDGQIILAPRVTGPRVVPHGDRLILDLGAVGEGAVDLDHLQERDRRLRDMVAYALLR